MRRLRFGHRGCGTSFALLEGHSQEEEAMEFRWAVTIALWTMLTGPIIGPPRAAPHPPETPRAAPTSPEPAPSMHSK
jgi:hypothetical protein